MSKSAKQQRIQKVGGNVAVEQTIVSDDSLLPTPAELEGYQNVSPDIIPWLLTETEREQAHRHSTDIEKINLLKSAVTNDRMFLVFFFILVLIFIGLCAIFLFYDKNVSGTIFGVVGLAGAYYLGKKFFNKGK